MLKTLILFETVLTSNHNFVLEQIFVYKMYTPVNHLVFYIKVVFKGGSNFHGFGSMMQTAVFMHPVYNMDVINQTFIYKKCMYSVSIMYLLSI